MRKISGRFRFIDWIMELPEERDRLFWQEITTYQQEKFMPFVTIAERVGREKGIERARRRDCLKAFSKALKHACK